MCIQVMYKIKIRLQRQNDTSDDSHELASIKSESQEATELVKFIHAESTSPFECGLSCELTPEEVSVSPQFLKCCL